MDESANGQAKIKDPALPYPTWMLLSVVVLLAGCAKSASQPSVGSSNPPDSQRAEVGPALSQADSVDEAEPNRGLPTESVTAPEIDRASASSNDPSLADLIIDEVSTEDEEPTATPGLAEQRRRRDQTVWQRETLAQHYERALVQLWDRMLAEQRKPAGDAFAVLSEQPLNSLRVATAGKPTNLRWNAIVAPLNEQPRVIPQQDWENYVSWFRQQGYRIIQTEWHHAKFDMDEDGCAKSTVTMAIYAEHPARETRFVVSGDLLIAWKPNSDERAMPVPGHIDASQLEVSWRKGPPAFQEILTIDHATPDTRSGVQPVLVRDLNGDGLSEIMLGGSNELLWNTGNGNFTTDGLCTHHEAGFEVALVADVTGDAIADYIKPGLAGDLLLYAADDQGRFSSPPKGKARGGGPLRQPQVIAAGDVDHDGDLDLWIGQYKISYLGGQMPTPYFDANDGFPAYLLINDGTGRFDSQTEEAGLAAKRNRRSYGGAFVDLDHDGDLDLVVVSDFSGVDVYHNDGHGYFTDVTDEMVDERHLFGMSATFSDYNVDGQLDFFVTGMASTTARRLEYMRLGRRDRPEIHLMRAKMGYGNRMYMATGSGFAQPAFRDQVARTGWTWGATSLDFDNDGYPDIFVANGHASGQSTKDHCSHFWCHDIYDATSQPDREVLNVFNDVMRGYFDRSESWDGYQKNQLLVNRDGKGFINLGFLMGVGHEYDGRAVISDDVDGDGRLDLIVVEDRWNAGQILHVYRNQLDTGNHWIGVQLVDRPGTDSPLGVTVTLTLTDGRKRIACVTAGDSIHAQHATTAHFGLGSQQGVKEIELRLVSGKVIKLDAPSIDTYHRVEIE